MRIRLKDKWIFVNKDQIIEDISIPHYFPFDVNSYPNPAFLSAEYRRKLCELKGTLKKRIILRFHGLDYQSEIFVNNMKVFEHTNGYDLFDVEITDFLKFDGEDILIVKVSDYDISEHPERVAGKQDWYGNAAGIIQDVELWIVDDVHIKSVRVYPREDLRTVNCFVEFSDELDHEYKLTVLDSQGSIVLNKEFNGGKISFEVPNPKIWSPKTPELYTLQINFNDGKNSDFFSTRFGIRYVKAENGKLLLNGEPVYLFGALDQNFYPDTHYTLRGRTKMLSELTKAKDLGLNLLRYHVKIPDDLYLEIADELGILVWIDLPYARELDEESKEYLWSLLKNVLQRHANHPSFVMMSLINESWGMKLWENMDEETKNWITSFYNEAKKLDPTRLIVDNSACCGNLHVVSDVDDYHFYHSFPYHNELWEEKVQKFASGEFRTFFERPEKKLPKVLSEFGVWGLPDIKTWEHSWSNYPITLMGIKFDGSSPAEIIKNIFGFHNLDDLILQTQLNQFMGLKFQIETIRLNPAIVGYVITEFSDIAWEANGLLDYNRMPKFFYSYLKYLNSDVLAIVKDHDSLLESSEYSMDLFISNMSSRKINGKVIIRTEKRVLKGLEVKVDSFELLNLGTFEFETNDEQNIFVEIFENDKVISRNFYPIMKLESKNCDYEIKWINDENHELNEFYVISEDEKIFGNLDWQGDWISGFTLFNTLRDINIGAILWGLNKLASKFILIPKDKFSSRNSVISKLIGWGFGLGSLLYVKNENGRFKVITTLKNTELSRKLISNILFNKED
jgi:hypothetical protein